MEFMERHAISHQINELNECYSFQFNNWCCGCVKWIYWFYFTFHFFHSDNKLISIHEWIEWVMSRGSWLMKEMKWFELIIGEWIGLAAIIQPQFTTISEWMAEFSCPQSIHSRQANHSINWNNLWMIASVNDGCLRLRRV